MFSRFEHVTPDLVPAVGVYVGEGLAIAISGQNGADVYNAMGRVTKVKPIFCRRWISHAKLAEWLALAGFMPPEKYNDQSTRIDPYGRYRKILEQGLFSPEEAKAQADTDVLDGLYFGVGGPITKLQSGNRDVSYVILGDWNR